MTAEAMQLILDRNATITEHFLRGVYSEDPDLKVLLDAERYSLFAGGKRIRPTLVLEFCRMFGGREEAALPFAAALEMIHTGSLIHDDLPCMDNDDLRRGKPTNHKVYGDAVALLAGDALLTGAFELTATNTEVSPEIAMMATAYLTASVGRYGMIGGQVMDMEGEHRKLTLDELLKLHSLKTGALINASCVLGALAAGITPNDAAMEKTVLYAEKIGLAFQIVDDILDRIGDEKALGKPTGGDQEHEKNTFLSFYSVEEAQFYADRLTAEAIDAIRTFENSETLVLLAKWLATRKK